MIPNRAFLNFVNDSLIAPWRTLVSSFGWSAHYRKLDIKMFLNFLKINLSNQLKGKLVIDHTDNINCFLTPLKTSNTPFLCFLSSIGLIDRCAESAKF